MIYFTADTHFGSHRTLELSRRPFKDVNEMDYVIKENWNKTVKPDDIVFHVGDFGNYEMVKELNGKITLFAGNYDINHMNKYFAGGKSQFKASLKVLGFENVILDKSYIIRDILDFDKVNISHCPEDCIKGGIFNLFGHVHQLCMVKWYGLNVGTDCHFFKPISLNTVMFYKNAIENHYDENVFE